MTCDVPHDLGLLVAAHVTGATERRGAALVWRANRAAELWRAKFGARRTVQLRRTEVARGDTPEGRT